MHLLAGFFISVCSGIFAFLAKFFAHKLAITGALIATVLAATSVCYGVMQAVVVGLVGSVDNEWFLMAFYLCWPDNATTCLSAMFATDVAVFLYRHQVIIACAVAKV
jgi:uncharacterized membrane protein YeaQ/YmgE (transglycosylase-associated protein family)